MSQLLFVVNRSFLLETLEHEKQSEEHRAQRKHHIKIDHRLCVYEPGYKSQPDNERHDRKNQKFFRHKINVCFQTVALPRSACFPSFVKSTTFFASLFLLSGQQKRPAFLLA